MACLILDDNGVIWTGPREEGETILAAVENGDTRDYKAQIGTKWFGDLILAEEIRRIR